MTRALLATILLAMLGLPASLHAQSLGDVAKRAEEERAKAPQGQVKSGDVKKGEKASATKVYTNRDLPVVFTPPPPLVRQQDAAPKKLMLFGGSGHKTYLGCVNCNEYATDSIFNEYGLHGSKYAVDSALNQYSQFGSHYSAYGVCNSYASDPPVIVDGNGRFYGRLTLNQSNPQSAHNASLLAWLAAVCAD